MGRGERASSSLASDPWGHRMFPGAETDHLTSGDAPEATRSEFEAPAAPVTPEGVPAPAAPAAASSTAFPEATDLLAEAPEAPVAPLGPLTLQRVQDYVWARYVEFEAPTEDVDEDAALALLEAHHQVHPMAQDPECFYYGILAYERSFAPGRDGRADLRRALRALQAYRAQVDQDFKWEPVDDRLADAVETLRTERDG